MRRLLSFIVLTCAMAMAIGAFAPGARAAALSSSILSVKADQTNIVEQARYRCWWRHGYRRCGYVSGYGWRHHYGWRHRYGWRHHYGWRHRYWRYHYGYRQNYWRERYWRYGYYRRHYNYDYSGDTSTDSAYDGYSYRPYYRRHYYYNSYTRPTYRYPRAGGYCIGLCWW